jgi:TfoX/Sxy family transcriptional regulator of competence genes
MKRDTKKKQKPSSNKQKSLMQEELGKKLLMNIWRNNSRLLKDSKKIHHYSLRFSPSE